MSLSRTGLRRRGVCKDMLLSCEEKYFLADVYSEGSLLAEKIKAKVIIDKLKTSDSICYLYPSSEEYNELSKNYNFEIEGSFEDIGGKMIGSIKIPRGYNANSKKEVLAPFWEKNVVVIRPDEIIIKNRIAVTEKNSEVVFNITHNKEVLPWGIRESDFKGNVKVGLEPRIILKSLKGWTITFDKYFRSKDTKVENIDGLFLYDYQVLKIEDINFKLTSVKDLSGIKELVDALLWYVSFATRQRTAWTGWSTIFGDEYVEYVCCNIWYLPHDPEACPLIDISELNDFLQHCLDRIEKPDMEKLDLYLPILYIVGSKNKTAEMQFLSLFMSLEALLNLFAKQKGLSGHLKKDLWRKFYKHIKESIEAFSFSSEEGKNAKNKDLMIRKLSRLNEPALVSFYEDFCNTYSVDNSDLWPVFGKNSELALSKIRNNLVHGTRFEYFYFLSIAIEHLQWVVERCLLSALDWNDSSDVNKNKLNKYYAYHNWKSFFKRISNE